MLSFFLLRVFSARVSVFWCVSEKKYVWIKRGREVFSHHPRPASVCTVRTLMHTHIDLDFPASLFQPGFSVSVRNLGKMGFVSHENSRDYPLGNELI